MLNLIEKTETVVLPGEKYNVFDLLQNIPGLCFDPSVTDPDYIWHDKQKEVCPPGAKNTLQYKAEDAWPLVFEELGVLLLVRIFLKKVLQVVSANRNKKLILSAVAEHLGQSFSTGGGTPCFVRRWILIYEHEGQVPPRKRRADAAEPHDQSSPVKKTRKSVQSRSKKASSLQVAVQPSTDPLELRSAVMPRNYAMQDQALIGPGGFLRSSEAQTSVIDLETDLVNEFLDEDFIDLGIFDEAH